jgi:hypothetical protein
MNMREKLQQQLAINQPSLKNYQVIKYVDKYVDAVMTQIAQQYTTVTSDELDSGEISFAAEQVYDQCGHAMICGQRVRTYKMMQAELNTSLIIVVYKGNSISKRISKVTFNPKYKNDIYKDMMEGDYLLNDIYLSKLADKVNFTIAVDMDALDSYIKNTQQSRIKSRGVKYSEKLCRNLLAAKQIKQKAVLQKDGSYVVSEYWETIDSGRMHGHEISLQRVAKEVRHAALGRCSRIDFKASSYAILTSLALEINPEIKVEEIKHYIQKRTVIRKRIAKQIGISEEWIKTIFTSLGFGAELTNNPFSSIRKKLGKDKYALLIANAEFMEIKRALNRVRDAVLKSYEFKGDAFKFGDFTYAALDSKTQKKRSKNQKLAWIYQACERMALDIVIDKMPNRFDQLLPVHDCVYIKQSLPAHVVLDLKFELRDLFPLLDFEQELIFPIHAAGDHNKYNDAIDADIAAHKSRMRQAGQDASGYVSKFFPQNLSLPEKPDYFNESNEDYEKRRKFDFFLSLEKHEADKKTRGYKSNSESDYGSYYDTEKNSDVDNAAG